MSDSSGALVDFVANVVGEAPLRVEESLGSGFVRLRVSEAERRQAKHDIRWVEDIVIELLRNARDAGARSIYLATCREGDTRTVVCIDNGSGIPDAMTDRVFEARVTSKLDTMCMDRWGVHGRGMALFSIRQNAQEAKVCASAPGLGTALRVQSDCTQLAERADQSTWPEVRRSEIGALEVARGPHNIVRTVVEFALESRREIAVYFGTPTDILATLVAHGDRELAARGLQFEPLGEGIPVYLRPAFSGDARTLAEQASKLGLDVSERTCYRILKGELAPLEPVSSCVMPKRQSPKRVDLLKDRRGLKVSKSDLADFERDLQRAFNTLGDRYYLSLKHGPSVHISGDTITVIFDIEKDD